LPLQPLDAHHELVDIATQLRRPVGPGAQLAQLPANFGNLARHVVTQLRNLVLEPGDPLGERVHTLAQVRNLAAQLAAPLHELRLLEREVVIHARKDRIAHRRDRGPRLTVHTLETSLARGGIPWRFGPGYCSKANLGSILIELTDLDRTVRECRNPERPRGLCRRVALKVLRRELGAALGPERFLSEIDVTANLQHPHLLPMFDSGEADGLLFYVMPYIEGEALR